MHQARYDHSACVIDSKIVVTGGVKAGRLAEIYNPKTNKWAKLPNLNKYRANHASCSINSKVVYIFGVGNVNKENRTIESLDIKNNK